MILSFRTLLVVLVIAIAICGCSRKEYKGPTVDAFVGRVTHQGKPVRFPDDEEIRLRLFFHDKGGALFIPLQQDGTFQIGWMPIGTYSAQLIREKKSARGQNLYGIPDNFKIEEGKTEYTIELGPKWKL